MYDCLPSKPLAQTHTSGVPIRQLCMPVLQPLYKDKHTAIV